MMRLAAPLKISFNLIRFQSLLNLRIFRLAVFAGAYYQLVELESNEENPIVVRFLYQGVDAEQVKRIILKEVCDVR